jgi:energy-coupling factor transporter ATP-binding protein EcfA2
MPELLAADVRSYRYRSGVVGLSDFSLGVAAGQCVVIRGPNGSGKTTALRCLCGLIPHLYAGDYDGTVRVDGIVTHEAPLWQTTSRIGTLLQNPLGSMITGAVADELQLGLQFEELSFREREARVTRVAETFGITGLFDRDPRTLSGGEQQRVLLAAALARDPAMLLLDEPSMRLDNRAVDTLVGQLEALLRAGKGIVVLDHDAVHESLGGARRVELTSVETCGALGNPDLDWLKGPGTCRLALDGVGVRQRRAVMLDGISMSIEGGEVVAVMGPNGAGKTTLLRALAGLCRHEGTITVEGNGRPDMAMIFENPDLQFFCPTVREELAHVRAPLGEREYRSLVDAFGLARFENTPPLLLSEGEKKRLSIALAIAARPAHGFLLDEPTLGLDFANRRHVGAVLEFLAGKGFACVVATHDSAWARAHATRIITMQRGNIESDEGVGTRQRAYAGT